MTSSGLADIPPFGQPLSATLCGLHSKKYGERLRDLICTFDVCFGRGFTCTYGELSFQYCHIHMAGALESEIKKRHAPEEKLKETEDDDWDFGDLWTKPPTTAVRRHANSGGELSTFQTSQLPDFSIGQSNEMMKRRLSVESSTSAKQHPRFEVSQTDDLPPTRLPTGDLDAQNITTPMEMDQQEGGSQPWPTDSKQPRTSLGGNG